MIDTIKLNLRDCTIKSSSQIIVQPSNFVSSTNKKLNDHDLFIDDYGKIITGNKAYLNTDKFNLTIQPSVEVWQDNDSTKLRKKRFKRIFKNKKIWDSAFDGEDDVTGIFIQTSLPRLKRQNNFKSLSVNEEIEFLKFLETELRKHGIKTNIWNAELSRVDTFVNLKTDYSFLNYSPLFNLMDCSRKKTVEWNGETFLWKNGEQQLMAYDKIQEMKNKNKKCRVPGGNFIRIENRYLKKRKIKSVLKLVKLDDLYKNYDVLRDNYKTEIEKNIFKYELPEIDLLTDDQIKNGMMLAKQMYKRQWFQKYLQVMGAWYITKSSNLDLLFENFEKVESRAALGMRKTRIKKLISEMKMILPENNFNSYKTNRELYNELREKFNKAA